MGRNQRSSVAGFELALPGPGGAARIQLPEQPLELRRGGTMPYSFSVVHYVQDHGPV